MLFLGFATGIFVGVIFGLFIFALLNANKK